MNRLIMDVTLRTCIKPPFLRALLICELHRLICDVTLRTCIKPPFLRARLICEKLNACYITQVR